jgi:hypothetical protein
MQSLKEHMWDKDVLEIGLHFYTHSLFQGAGWWRKGGGGGGGTPGPPSCKNGENILINW